jgi:hypothetical protein
LTLEQWDASRQKWILYTSQQKHSYDCVRHPFENIPSRIFLDTNVINVLVKYATSIFEHDDIPSTVPMTRANEIEALMHIFFVGQRACWDLVASAKTMEEISLTPDPGTRNDLLGYVREIIEIGTEQSVLGDNLGKRLADALPVAALPDRSDRELIGNAIGLNCDAFCTCDHRTIIAKRHLLPKMELKILTPVEWWAHIKPWAALWC